MKDQVQNLDILNSGDNILLETIFNKSLSYIDSAILGLANVLQDIMGYVIELFIFVVSFFFHYLSLRKIDIGFHLCSKAIS